METLDKISSTFPWERPSVTTFLFFFTSLHQSCCKIGSTLKGKDFFWGNFFPSRVVPYWQETHTYLTEIPPLVVYPFLLKWFCRNHCSGFYYVIQLILGQIFTAIHHFRFLAMYDKNTQRVSIISLVKLKFLNSEAIYFACNLFERLGICDNQ